MLNRTISSELDEVDGVRTIEREFDGEVTE
jgi:hypothetical protein